MKLLVGSLCLLLAISACDSASGPPLEISKVKIYAPLPGTRTSVAYMTIRNNSASAIRIGSIESPQFDSVMLHETRIEDGVARMRMLDGLEIPARSEVFLVDGGLHLMLDQPAASVAEGEPATLQFAYDGNGLVIVSTTILSRFADERTNR